MSAMRKKKEMPELQLDGNGSGTNVEIGCGHCSVCHVRKR